MTVCRSLTISGATPTLRRGVWHLMHLLLTLERAPYDTRLNLNFVSLAYMRQLNRKYKGSDAPTDVLTFTPMGKANSFVNDLLFSDSLEVGSGAEVVGAALSTSPACCVEVTAAPTPLTQSAIRAELVDLGDIFISLDYMRLRRNRYPSSTLPLAPYLHAALVHAVLHALGYDHASPDLLQQMVRREQQLGRQLAMIARQHPSRSAAECVGGQEAIAFSPLSLSTARRLSPFLPEGLGEPITFARMEAFRSLRRTCHATLAPSIAKEEKGHVLRVFNAPSRCAELEVLNPVLCAHRSTAVVKRQPLSPIDFDPLLCIEKMTAEMMTNRDAERIAYPMHTHAVSFEQLLAVLTKKLRHTVRTVSWNSPQERPEWDSELRFYGPWWLVVRSEHQLRGKYGSPLSILGRRESSFSTAALKYTADALIFKVHEGKPENQYAPLLVERSFEAENQLFADIALRLGGKTFHLNLFHLSGVFVGPDRMQVLIFDGFRRLCTAVAAERATESAMQSDFLDCEDGLLSTLSFSFCHIGSAGLLILLVGIIFLSVHHDCHVHSLDLSYNDLTKSSLWCLTQAMPFTKIRRLSLRGNFLSGNDASTLREFLLEGCDRELEELDLSYTFLSAEQVRTLIYCLPHLSSLRVLLLEEVTIPSAHWPAFAGVVERMHLWRVELFSQPPSSVMAGYAKTIKEICCRNRQRAMEGSNSDEVVRWGTSTFFGIKDSSFFRAFFHLSRLRGGLPSDRPVNALPEGYGAFTNNDPSLQLADARNNVRL